MTIEQMIENIKSEIKRTETYHVIISGELYDIFNNILPIIESTQQTQNELIAFLNKINDSAGICIFYDKCLNRNEELMEKISNFIKFIKDGK